MTDAITAAWMDPVPVAGLLIPAALVPRIIAALRGTYPTATAGLTDDQVVRAVLRMWITQTLATYEAAAVASGVDTAVARLRADYATAASAARAKAETDAATITEQPLPPPDTATA